MARTGLIDGLGGFFLGDIAGHVVGAPIDAVLDRAAEPKTTRIAHTKLPKNLVLAVTTQRLLLFGRNKTVVDAPFANVASVQRLTGQFALWVPVFRVQIRFKNGAMLPLETSPFLWREASACIAALERATWPPPSQVKGADNA
jgi:hypothetical protein